MAWRRRKIDVEPEKDIITGMIVSDRFLQEIQPILKIDLLQVPFAKIVAVWCNDYWNRYEKAPGSTIQDIYNTFAKKELDENVSDLIGKFLESLSEKYEESETFNAPYALDKAEAYLKGRALEELSKDIKVYKEAGNLAEAEALVSTFQRIERPASVGVDPLSKEAIEEAFSEDDSDVLFKLPGVLGEQVDYFEREQLWSVVAPSNRGKSWWLQEMAIRAALAKFNVLFVSFEVSRKKMIKRIAHTLSGMPKEKYAGKVLIPVFDCIKNQKDTCDLKRRRNNIALFDDNGKKPNFDDVDEDYRICTLCRGTRQFMAGTWFKEKEKEALTKPQAIKKADAITRSLIRSNKIHLVQFPDRSVSIPQLNTYIDNLEYYDNFIPDVVITDYADKMVAERRTERRHELGEIWSGHKALAQKRHCLVFTASQSNTSRTGKKVGQGDWADDITKLNVVDGAFALNQTIQQRREGLMLITLLKQREEDFDLATDIKVLQQLRVGKPYLDSSL